MPEKQKFVNIEHTSSGIVCDNPECDYEDKTASDENFCEFLNVPCPKCGQNLLTEEDLNTANQILEIANMLNNMTQEQMTEVLEKVTGKTISELTTEDTSIQNVLELGLKAHNGVQIESVNISEKKTSEE